MEIPKEVSIKRALLRYKENRGGEAEYGRYVPISVIDEFFDTGDKGFQSLKNDVDGFIKIDSLTNKVIERGGEPIPETRSYAEVFEQPEKTSPERVERKPTKEDIMAAESAAKTMLKYADAKTKKDLNGYLKALKVLKKYV